eukprot:TRINITY_DN39394_c0_g1_i1.p2 TRINITY_DN39394_c0_g1~~TRINITY_DN39394_c0_g1_i1.p2  ORF type:complete len:101 (-),score=9.48 TRINITY_DN39394_c0_g1_i1:59-361(-)
MMVLDERPPLVKQLRVANPLQRHCKPCDCFPQKHVRIHHLMPHRVYLGGLKSKAPLPQNKRSVSIAPFCVAYTAFLQIAISNLLELTSHPAAKGYWHLEK